MMMRTTAAQLAAAISTLSGAIERRNTLPVLGAALVQSGRLTVTNLDMEATVSCGSIEADDNPVAVDYFGLAALCRLIGRDEEVLLSDAGGAATLAFQGGSYRMPAWPLDDFPVFGEIEGQAHATDNLGIVAGLKRVRPYASTEETRYYLNGVAVVRDHYGQPSLCATNGHSLALVPLPAAADDWQGAILPNCAVSWLARRGVEPEQMAVARERCRATFKLPGAVLKTKLIDGNFPDVLRVIPRDPEFVFSADRADMLSRLARLRAFVTMRGTGVKLEGGGGQAYTDRRLRRRASGDGNDAACGLSQRAVRGRFQRRLSRARSLHLHGRHRDVLQRRWQQQRRSSGHQGGWRRCAGAAHADAGVRK